MYGIDWNARGCKWWNDMVEQGCFDKSTNLCETRPSKLTKRGRTIYHKTYCTQHLHISGISSKWICGEPNCTNAKFENDIFCNKCECPMKHCRNKIEDPESDICSNHRCRQCRSMILKKAIYSINCSFGYLSNCGRYCNECACKVPRCDEVRERESDYCEDHECERCKSVNYSDNSRCTHCFHVEEKIELLQSWKTFAYACLHANTNNWTHSRINAYLLKQKLLQININDDVIGLVIRCTMILPRDIFNIVLSYL